MGGEVESLPGSEDKKEVTKKDGSGARFLSQDIREEGRPVPRVDTVDLAKLRELWISNSNDRMVRTKWKPRTQKIIPELLVDTKYLKVELGWYHSKDFICMNWCHTWLNDTGCKKGRECQFLHTSPDEYGFMIHKWTPEDALTKELKVEVLRICNMIAGRRKEEESKRFYVDQTPRSIATMKPTGAVAKRQVIKQKARVVVAKQEAKDVVIKLHFLAVGVADLGKLLNIDVHGVAKANSPREVMVGQLELARKFFTKGEIFPMLDCCSVALSWANVLCGQLRIVEDEIDVSNTFYVLT